MRQSTKNWTTTKRNTLLIQFLLPEDFGTRDYFKRQSKAFNNLLENLGKTEELRIIFDKLLQPSTSLRDYLWVNDNEAIELGRIALRIIPKFLVLKCICWALRDFWNRQSGWPDLFIFKNNEFRFVEVKTPNDELSLEQMKWFKWAIEEVHIPCELVRLQRATNTI
jgi:hypothetical protein